MADKVRPCWHVNDGGRDASQLLVYIIVDMAPDGRVTDARISDETQAAMASNPFLRSFAEAGRRAVLNPRCQPLPYPQHKYEQLKRFVFKFDPRDLPVFRAANMAGVRITARLDGADFSGADLSNASFAVWQERDLGGAPTSGLARCNFTGARMRGVNLRGLSLTQASLKDADLSDADLRDTDLTGANLTGAVLKGARLDRAKLDGAVGLSASPRD